MTHNFRHCTITPPLERAVVDGELADRPLETGEPFQLWPTRLLVCIRCWEVQLSSTPPNGEERDALVTVENSGSWDLQCKYCDEEEEEKDEESDK